MSRLYNARAWWFACMVLFVFSVAWLGDSLAQGSWLSAAIDGPAAGVDLGLAVFWHRRIPPRLSLAETSRLAHERCLAETDRLERELRIGRYAKTEAEFDAEVERVVRPFRWRLQQASLLLLHVYLTQRGRSGMSSWGSFRGHGRASAAASIGQAYARTIRAMIGDEKEER